MASPMRIILEENTSTASFMKDGKGPAFLAASPTTAAPERPNDLIALRHLSVQSKANRRISVQSQVSMNLSGSNAVHIHREGHGHGEGPEPTPKGQRGFRFWMVFASNLLVEMLSALDLTAVSTALPTIVDRLHGNDFIWAGGAYTIASTAVLPLVGGFVSGFGRKYVLLAFIAFFAVGSVLCGAAQNLTMLIVGRAFQGIGSGGSLSVTEIIFADMVPLPERGKFQGIAAAVWALACAIGPPIGGALAGSGAWRWLFYMNIPLGAAATLAIVCFLPNVVPAGSAKKKLLEMDWIGNAIIITSTILVFLGLTWGGLRFPWISGEVLSTVILGVLGIAAFLVLEKFWLHGQTVPDFFFTNRTTLSGYLGTFFHGVVSLTAIYYLPIYLQASKEASALRSGIEMFGLSFSIPIFAIIAGISVEVLRFYRPQNYIGWLFTIVGFVLLSLLKADSTAAAFIGFQIPLGIGLGILWIGTQFPILAPLPFSNSAYALAFFIFIRNFAQSWGIVVGGAILQNVLEDKLPSSLKDTLPKGQEFAYQLIPQIPGMSDPQKADVRAAFASGTRVIWLVMLGLSVAGLLTCLLMREEELKTEMDDTWAVVEKAKKVEEDDRV